MRTKCSKNIFIRNFSTRFFLTASTHRDTSIAHVFDDFGPPGAPHTIGVVHMISGGNMEIFLKFSSRLPMGVGVGHVPGHRKPQK